MPRARKQNKDAEGPEYISDPSADFVRKLGICKWCSTEGRLLELGTDGFCPKGGGYPYGAEPPFACQWCGYKLDWFGLCERCLSPGAPKSEWPLQGDGYSVVGNHWVATSGAPRQMADSRDWADGMRQVSAILAVAGKVDRQTFLSKVREYARRSG